MSERLEKEITQKYRNDTGTLKSKEQYTKLAEYYYNLALKDVKEEMERRVVENTKAQIESDSDLAQDVMTGSIGAYMSMLHFIDKLTK